MGFGPEDAFRLLDGAGDGVPGLVIDQFAGRWLAQSGGPMLPEWEAAFLINDLPVWWKQLDSKEKDNPVPLDPKCGDQADPFLVREHDLSFEISFQSGYSQGIFLDQRENRRRVRESLGQGSQFLNLFAYTCGFSVAAAAAGASTSSVDLSGPALEWGKRNFSHNNLDPAGHHFPKGDALEYLAIFAKKGRKFDGIVLDPPTFSRNKGKVWRVEEDFHLLVAAAAKVLAPGGWMLCSTNCRRLAQWLFDEQIHIGFSEAGRRCEVDWGVMPPDFRGDPYLLNGWCRA